MDRLFGAREFAVVHSELAAGLSTKKIEQLVECAERIVSIRKWVGREFPKSAHVELEPRVRSFLNHPLQRHIGQTSCSVAATDIRMRAGEPHLLERLVFRRDTRMLLPQRRDKFCAVLVHRGVESLGDHPKIDLTGKRKDGVIMGDACLAIAAADHRVITGRLFNDESALREVVGVTDFSKYPVY